MLSVALASRSVIVGVGGLLESGVPVIQTTNSLESVVVYAILLVVIVQQTGTTQEIVVAVIHPVQVVRHAKMVLV